MSTVSHHKLREVGTWSVPVLRLGFASDPVIQWFNYFVNLSALVLPDTTTGIKGPGNVAVTCCCEAWELRVIQRPSYFSPYVDGTFVWKGLNDGLIAASKVFKGRSTSNANTCYPRATSVRFFRSQNFCWAMQNTNNIDEPFGSSAKNMTSLLPCHILHSTS